MKNLTIFLILLLPNLCLAQKAMFTLSNKPGSYSFEFATIKNNIVFGSNHSLISNTRCFGLNFGIYKSSKYFDVVPMLKTTYSGISTRGDNLFNKIQHNTKLYFCCHVFIPKYVRGGIAPYFEICKKPKLINRMTLSIIF